MRQSWIALPSMACRNCQIQHRKSEGQVFSEVQGKLYDDDSKVPLEESLLPSFFTSKLAN
jgi:hypothetical protein